MKPARTSGQGNPLDIWMYVILAAVLVIVAVLSWMYYDLRLHSKPLKVEVFLDNRCELFDEAFVAVAEPDDRRSHFDKGVAILETTTRSRIFVRSSDRFPDFQFETSRFPAQPRLVITAECGNRPHRSREARCEHFLNRPK